MTDIEHKFYDISDDDYDDYEDLKDLIMTESDFEDEDEKMDKIQQVGGDTDFWFLKETKYLT